MARTENLCLLSASHQLLLSTVLTASAFFVHYPVHVHAAPQSQSFSSLTAMAISTPSPEAFSLDVTFANEFGSVYFAA